MIFEGNSLSVKQLDNGIVELNFDRQDFLVNKLDVETLLELKEALSAIYSDNSVKGLLINSAKNDFIVSADTTEVLDWFNSPENASEEEFTTRLLDTHNIFNMLEDAPFPTVCAINGVAFGGGFELPLCTDYRLITTKSKVGFPEVNLGLLPAWGGSFRLPRLIGLDHAFDWITTGRAQQPDEALEKGAVDGVVEPDQLHEAALKTLTRCIQGELDYVRRREEKRRPIKLNQLEQLMSFATARRLILGKAGPHYPAPKIILDTMQKHANLHRDEAMMIEVQGFIKAARTKVAANLIGLFLNDQELERQAKKITKKATPVNTAAVLGAGVMGGGIAYQSALKGTPIIMKDIDNDTIILGLKEAKKLLTKQVNKGCMTTEALADALTRINTTLSYGDIANADIVIEAVVENTDIKKSVLAELEELIGDDVIIASNTSTISISELASATKYPERVCGMHFFNPVSRMPLVEIIRGEKTSAETIATTVAYALAIGKKPIIVNDAPGFLVNRVLFPYLNAFEKLIRDGADFIHIDKVMQDFGWPMGPAHLLDVIGLDVACHASAVLAEGFPDRMTIGFESATQALHKKGHLGQKSGSGYYRYELDRRGKLQKKPDEEAIVLVKACSHATRQADEFSDEEIIERMMFALCFEVVRCLEDNIVDSPEAADMGLIWGIGFPRFRGGALRYIDSIGTQEFVKRAEKYADLGATYSVPKLLADMASNNIQFFGSSMSTSSTANTEA